MGNISFLTGTSSAGPLSIKESLHQFENSSILFKNYWLKTPPDYTRASSVSAKAMEHLDHVVNEIMRARDTQMGKGAYAGSVLETQLNINRGKMLAGVDRTQQQQMLDNGAGNGVLPSSGTPIKLETLLNKIKHRHHQSANFRFQDDKHIFVINVDKMNKTPDSIVEFDVLEFCEHCNDVSSYM
jgi:hypothetical protein